ncbi:MAG: DNA-deoxyinosine glycosylase, partial [Candidatus Ornithomonoglobus sp.]
HKNHIALWDVIASCEITGSSDSSIKNVVPNDLSPILGAAPIEKIFVNGRASEKYYIKYQEKTLGRGAIYLPSTSPANAAWSVERLAEEWRIIR